MADIVLASNNKKKIEELRFLLSDIPGVRVLSLQDVGIDGDIEEYGKTFEENSMIKASVPASRGYIGIADDSGLCVDALGGEPGIYSARYAGEHGDDGANRQKLLEKLANVKDEDRGGGFVCVASVVLPENSPYSIPEEYKANAEYTENIGISRERAAYVRGECRGFIMREESGNEGFGYDSIFYSPEVGKGFGNATKEEKNSVSHRGRAMKQFVLLLETILKSERK